MANDGTANATETSRATDRNGPVDQTRPTCFVIQPFDRGKFDKRYEDAFEPGLGKAGFEAYRVDQDPGTDVVIAAIEEGIRRAAICLADVTTNNPNVWYELGYAYAADKPARLRFASRQALREGALIPGTTANRQPNYVRRGVNFGRRSGVSFGRRLTRVAEKQMADADPIAPQDGLAQREIHLLGLAARETATPDVRVGTWALENNAKSSGLTPVAFGLAFRGLTRRAFMKTERVEDHDGEYDGVYVTDEGWRWIEEHDHLFNLEWSPKASYVDLDAFDDDIPF